MMVSSVTRVPATRTTPCSSGASGSGGGVSARAIAMHSSLHRSADRDSRDAIYLYHGSPVQCAIERDQLSGGCKPRSTATRVSPLLRLYHAARSMRFCQADPGRGPAAGAPTVLTEDALE